MPLINGNATCDSCGEPATTVARDMVRYEHPSMLIAEWAPASDRVKYGCEEHPVESVEYVSAALPPWRRK